MRIGIDARLWNETGVGRYIRNLVWNLQDLDKSNSYVLFISGKLKTEDLSLKNKNWKVIATDIRWHTLEEQTQFRRVLEKENLDLVHFPYFSVPIFYKGPYVITIHDLIIHHFPTGKASTLPSPVYYLKLFGYKYVIKQAAKNAQKVITVSQSTKDEIVKHLGVSPDKVTVTYEGVEERDPWDKSQNSKLPIPQTQDPELIEGQLKNQKYFLYVGNAYPHKNLDRLVEAFNLIISEFPDIKLVLVGKDDYFYQRLQDKIKNLGIANNVIFAGFVPEEVLQVYYQNARATVLPSLMEGFGLTGLEAMKNNCLVLASDIPSLKEIYQDAAMYFDPLAIDSLHATIREVLTEEKAVQHYIVNGKKILGFYSWEKMAEQTLKVYESCTRVRSDQ